MCLLIATTHTHPDTPLACSSVADPGARPPACELPRRSAAPALPVPLCRHPPPCAQMLGGRHPHEDVRAAPRARSPPCCWLWWRKASVQGRPTTPSAARSAPHPRPRLRGTRSWRTLARTTRVPGRRRQGLAVPVQGRVADSGRTRWMCPRPPVATTAIGPARRLVALACRRWLRKQHEIGPALASVRSATDHRQYVWIVCGLHRRTMWRDRVCGADTDDTKDSQHVGRTKACAFS